MQIDLTIAAFQSTLPARGATNKYLKISTYLKISIHAPRTGSDDVALLAAPAHGYFNPRSPHGERRISLPSTRSDARFQSTLPARGATAQRLHRRVVGDISIHAPRTGSDRAP